ncbi:Tn3 family transposase [Escherichia coli]|nr:Tn3 family transposase [Escherichia coli]OKV14720.1 Tn3 family transposase [Escherichia coli]OKV60443.1 Tn3 family transposase [Escherichia coli]OKV82355.1 Tn3 family transposase [Escherichia coli]OKW05583.1 Tn3 family transposase [Escherichia coli]
MARRQILSQSEKESLLALPDDELTLTRMTYFSEQDLAIMDLPLYFQTSVIT